MQKPKESRTAKLLSAFVHLIMAKVYIAKHQEKYKDLKD
jgi:hypothetical protein